MPDPLMKSAIIDAADVTVAASVFPTDRVIVAAVVTVALIR